LNFDNIGQNKGDFMLHSTFEHVTTTRSLDAIVKDFKLLSQLEAVDGAAVIAAAVQAGEATYEEVLTEIAHRSDMVTAGKSIEEIQAEFTDPATRMHLAPQHEREAVRLAFNALYPVFPLSVKNVPCLFSQIQLGEETAFVSG
jgi:hypothetical protein